MTEFGNHYRNRFFPWVPIFQCGGAWPFLVGGVNRLVNFVDDRDLCLLYCVKYDSY